MEREHVDGFHRAAGSKNVIDIHGDLPVAACEALWSARDRWRHT